MKGVIIGTKKKQILEAIKALKQLIVSEEAKRLRNENTAE
jgi:hypothetical protein